MNDEVIKKEDDYDRLISEKQELEKKIELARVTRIKTALHEIKIIISNVNLTYEELLPILPKSLKTKQGSKKLAVKYINRETGQTWSGRGKVPKWIEGKDKEQFKV